MVFVLWIMNGLHMVDIRNILIHIWIETVESLWSVQAFKHTLHWLGWTHFYIVHLFNFGLFEVTNLCSLSWGFEKALLIVALIKILKLSNYKVLVRLVCILISAFDVAESFHSIQLAWWWIISNSLIWLWVRYLV